MLLKDIIASRLEQLRTEIRENMERAGENASGRTSASFAIESEDTRVRLVGGGSDCAPLATLEVGARPHWAPIAPLYQWSIDKGLQFATDSERVSFAYALRWKIAKKGTNRYTKNVDIYTSAVERAIDDIVNLASVEVTKKMQNELNI